MTLPKIVFCVAVMWAASSAQVYAHHGGNIEFDNEKVAGPITLTATRFAFAFPHPQFYGEMKDERGNIQPWNLVMRLTPTGLRQLGWARDSIKPGDMLTVTYRPHRSMPNVGLATRVLVNGKWLPLEEGEKPE